MAQYNWCNISELGQVFKWPTTMCDTLVRYLSVPLEWVGFSVQYWPIRWSGYVTYSTVWLFLWHIGQSNQAFEWPTKVGGISAVILVNWVGYFSGPLEWVDLWAQYWLIRCGILKWPTNMFGILGAILVNKVRHSSGPLEWVRFSSQYWWIRWCNHVAHSNGLNIGK